MREQLIQYVKLLFAGTSGYEDVKQEILQNTLDRYDDLIAEGKVPQAAYRLAIAGIGDINEILGTASTFSPDQLHTSKPESAAEDKNRKQKRALAIALYILCPIPVILGSTIGLDVLGLCGTFVVVAIATAMIIVSGKKEEGQPKELTPREKQRKSIETVIDVIGLVVYFLLSFRTFAWHITWLVFPITAVVWEIVKAILDLKEATAYEV